MRDRNDRKGASSSKQSAGARTERGRSKSTGTAAVAASRAHSAPEDVKLSRTWGGPGATITITSTSKPRTPMNKWRVLFGLYQGGDGYILLPVVHTEGDDRSVSFTVPSRTLPGVHVVQLEHEGDFHRRLPFIVTPHEPPADSPFRRLRTEPPNGTLRMYQILCRHRSNPDKAIEEMTQYMRGYDTYLDPMPIDEQFQEILDESLTAYERRKKFATWLVTHQLAAEGES